jgi:hypothetical protein
MTLIAAWRATDVMIGMALTLCIEVMWSMFGRQPASVVVTDGLR